MGRSTPDVPTVTGVEVGAFRVPTDRPEGDGTMRWDATTLVLVEAPSDGGLRGLGYTYCAAAAATVVHETLAEVVQGHPIDDPRGAWERMVAATRNMGRPGIAACAISAIDIALWDLKAKWQNQPLFQALGPRRRAVPIYGSGGFTTYPEEELVEQLAGWVGEGISQVKMKIGTDWGSRPEVDLARVRAARRAIGSQAELFVDANGAYTTKQAVELAGRFRQEAGVTYFEEPVSSDHLEQLVFVRHRTSLDVAAGEYGYDPWYFRDMLAAGAVDILQADASRCLGITGWLKAAELAYSFGTPFSAHTVPAVHAHLGCAAQQISHIEYFHTHARIEEMVFDGAPRPVAGTLAPSTDRPGLGLDARRSELDQYRVA